MSERVLEGQIALVTGASRGIGYESALAYARAGAHIVAVARTVGGLEELDDAVRAVGSEATLVPLDLRDGEGIDRLAPALAERYGRLDILLGNAGILGPQTPIPHLADKDWIETFDVNVNANMRLLRGLDPLLKAAPSGRGLFIVADAAVDAPAYLAPYAASKAALSALVKTYANETRQTQVTANLVLPGPLRTHLRSKHFPGEDASVLATPGDFATYLPTVTQEAAERSGACWSYLAKGWLTNVSS